MDINSILLDEKFAKYCRYVSNNSSLWQDLYQEFRIVVFTTFNKIQSADSPEAYCRSIIYNLWRLGNGYGHGTSQAKESLVNYSDTAYEINDRLLLVDESDHDCSVYEKEVNRLMRSESNRVQKKALIFNEFISGKNRLEISRQTGINYRTVYDAVKETAETIKHNMTKNEIKSALLAQGISSSYSGKTKTFHTNKKPSPDLEKSIIAVGFKVNVK